MSDLTVKDCEERLHRYLEDWEEGQLGREEGLVYNVAMLVKLAKQMEKELRIRRAQQPHHAAGDPVTQGAFNALIARKKALEQQLQEARDQIPWRDGRPLTPEEVRKMRLDLDFYKRREESICEAVGQVADDGQFRNDIIARLERLYREHATMKKQLEEYQSAEQESSCAHDMVNDECINCGVRFSAPP